MLHGPKGLFSTAIYPQQTDEKPSLIFSLVGNPQFNLSQFPKHIQSSYISFVSSLAHQELFYPNPIAYMPVDQDADSYYIARTVQNHVMALLSVFRATRSFEVLDRTLELMTILYSTLKDMDGDGRLEWFDLGPGSGTPTPTEDSMNTNMTDTLAVMWAYVMFLNRRFKPEYKASYQQWISYVENTVLVDSNHGLQSRILTHCWTFMLRLLWYLYKLYNNPYYLSVLEDRLIVFENTMVLRPTQHGISRVWEHRINYPGYPQQGCQGLGYASYTVRNIADLAFEGFSHFNTEYMNNLVNTARDLAFRDGLNAIHDDVCGDEYPEDYPVPWPTEEHYNISRYAIWSWQILAAWDNSGFIDNLGVQGLTAYPSTPTIFIPAYQLVAEIYRYINS